MLVNIDLWKIDLGQTFEITSWLINMIVKLVYLDLLVITCSLVPHSILIKNKMNQNKN